MRLCLISVQDVYLVHMVDCQIANFELTGTDYNTKEMLILNMFNDGTMIYGKIIHTSSNHDMQPYVVVNLL